MISRKILHRRSAGKATHYYADQKDDYFSRDGGAAQWQGKAAAALGLAGDIDPPKFFAAMRGDFGPGVQLPYSIRLDSKARAALDLTFSAPKSVSIQALVGKDAAVLAAHDLAVTRALEYLESELMLARRKEAGVSKVERTANAAIAKWRHETSRPSADAPSDPQLHTHALVLNITQRADGSWTAMSNEAIFRSLRLLDAVYQAELAAGLEKAGYALRREGKHVELAHISREQVKAFSKRSADIEGELAKIGETRATASHGLKQTVTLRTRRAKDEVTRATLQQEWERQATELGIDFSGQAGRAEMERGGHDRQADRPDAPGLDAPDAGEPQPAEWGPDQHDIPEAEPAVSAPETSADRRGGRRGQFGSGQDGAPRPGRGGGRSGTKRGETDSQALAARARVAQEAVRWAIKHLTERESVVHERHLLASALNYCAGTGVKVGELRAAIGDFLRRGHLILGTTQFRAAHREGQAMTRQEWVAQLVAAGEPAAEARRRVRQAIAEGTLLQDEPRYTTQVAREREKRILQIERDGRGKVGPILEAEAAKAALATRSLKPGQLVSAELILSTADRVVGVQGLAGTGKSHMLKQVKEIAEGAGYTVRAVASYGMQIRALRELGVQARTIASMLAARQQDRFTLDEKTVLVVDEAGVVPTRLLEKLLQRAEQAGARVVLLGDTGQTKAIEAGKPFAQLQAAGMATARMGDIIRQQNPELRRAVELAADGQAEASITILDTKLQAVREVPADAVRYDQIARDYAALSPEERAETLILTGTNKSRNALNEAAHQALGLAGRGFEFDLLTRRDTTQAERRRAQHYEVNDVIQPERDYQASKLLSGEMYRIVDRDLTRNRLSVVHVATGIELSINPARATKLSVYQPIRAELSAGDVVRVTRQDAARDLANGDRFEVAAVTPTSVVLRQGERRVEFDARTPLHLDRAYATTAHSAQGLTCDRALINAESYTRTTKADVFYVGISRARHSSIVYTDDASELPAAASRREDKSAALDIGLLPVRDRAQRAKELARSTHDFSISP